MAETSSDASGEVRGENRPTTFPSRSKRNFSKFQLIFPFPVGSVSTLVKYLKSGAALSPLTSILSNMSKETLYLEEQN